MNYRKRDGIAAILTIYLLILALNRSNNNTTISSNSRIAASLSFYTEYSAFHPCNNKTTKREPVCWIETARPIVLDWDGDDIIDSLIVPSANGLRVLNLRNAEEDDEEDSLVPFYPPVMVRFTNDNRTSSGENATQPIPIRIAATSSSSLMGDSSTRSVRVCTLWNDGNVTLHSVVPFRTLNDESAKSYDWKISLFSNAMDASEADVLFARDGETVIVSGRDSTEPDVPLSYHAVDSQTGAIRWRHSHDNRRRFNTNRTSTNATSIIPPSNFHGLLKQRRGERFFRPSTTAPFEEHTKNCLLQFRHSITHENSEQLRVFPHAYWGSRDDTRMHLGRLERSASVKVTSDVVRESKRRKMFSHSVSVSRDESSLSSSSKKKQQQQNNPNVIVSHGRNGIEILSFKNGHSVCHLSLLEQGFYADINRDGVIDFVQVPTNHPLKQPHHNAQYTKKSDTDPIKPCHITVSSGIPIREELFTASLCTRGRNAAEQNNRMTIHAAPPLLVRNDLVFAVNSGIVSKYDSHGSLSWQTHPSYDKQKYPTWDASERASAHVGQIILPSFSGPIVVSGHDRMAFFSFDTGRLIASASFPQDSVMRPLLMDWNGDGVTDVLIMSTDAIWGYKVEVYGSLVDSFGLLVGLLLLGLGVALVMHHLGDEKRSTDL